MLKNLVSVAAAAVLAAAPVAPNQNAVILNDGVKGISFNPYTLTVAPENMLNVQIVDKDGNNVYGIKGTMKNSAGTPVAEFIEYAPEISTDPSVIPGSDYYVNELNSSGISGSTSWEEPWETFNQYVYPNTLQYIQKDSLGYSPGSSLSFSTDSAESRTFTFESCNLNEAAAFTVPAGGLAFYIDDDWASKTGKGFYRYSYDNPKIYFESGAALGGTMIGKVNQMLFLEKPDLSNLIVGTEVDADSDQGGYVSNPPKFQSTGTEYVLHRAHLSEIFPAEYFPQFNMNGTFIYEDMLFDLGTDLHLNYEDGYYETSCVISVTSGACLSMPIPDAQGYIEFYVEKNSREYYAEVGLDYMYTHSGGYTKGSWGFDHDGYGGDIRNVTITPVFVGTTKGANMNRIPAGSYTIELSDVPGQYVNPGAVSVNVAQSQELQYLEIVLEDYTAPTTPPTTTVPTTPPATVTPSQPTYCKLGDVDGEGNINALDASMVLTEYAMTATNQGSILTDVRKSAANVNKDANIDALDASLILTYYAYTATNGTESFEDFLQSKA
ncbi:MAG: hypothetical protein IJX77_07540 [Ruminococcus sp.]|nr:hypothetical protein [Ruminococcus sp.]